MDWIKTEVCLPKEMVVVLTQHIDDLYPAVAYRYGDNHWLREREGPEDIVLSGRDEELYRPPTHWMSLPILLEG